MSSISIALHLLAADWLNTASGRLASDRRHLARDQGTEETRRTDHPADARRSGQAGAGSSRHRSPLQVRLDRAAARSDLREARAAEGGQVSAAWSLGGAYAISAVDLVADSAVIPVIPAGLEPATYALGKRRSDPAELWDLT